MVYGQYDDIRTDASDNTIIVLTKNMHPENVYIEIGAHVGWIAVPVIMQSNPKFSILVEPHRGSVGYLTKNLEENAPNAKYAIVSKLALDKVGQAIYYDFGSPPHCSIYKRTKLATPVQRDTVTIDSLVEEYKITEQLKIKIDAELAEPLIWKGMKECIKREQIDLIVMEFMPNHLLKDMKIDPRDFIREIEGDGFAVEGARGKLKENEIYQPTGNKIDLVLRRI